VKRVELKSPLHKNWCILGVNLRNITKMRNSYVEYTSGRWYSDQIPGEENSLLLAQIVAPSLSSSYCYATSEIFDFGDNLAAISPTIKEGFSRLMKLDLSDCQGDVRMVVENAPIQDLRSLGFGSFLGDGSETAIAMAENNRSLKCIYLSATFDSSINLT
jgi:hypothetical protein